MSLPIPVLPTTLGTYALSAGGFSVTLPNTVDSADEPIGSTTYFEKVDGRDGLFPFRNPTFQGRSLTLSGLVMSSVIIQGLKRVVGYGRLTVTRGGLSMSADVSDLSVVEEIYSKIWRVSLSLESPDYYWVGDTQTTNGSPTTVPNAGDLDAFPVFSVTGGVGGLASINFALDGREVEWTGNLAEGDILVVDCGDLTAQVDTANELNNMNTSFFVNPLRIAPGANSITTTINGSATYTIEHKERFL